MKHNIRPRTTYSASLRIMGNRLPNYKVINKKMDLLPSHAHREGDYTGHAGNKQYEQDLWIYTAQLSEKVPLERHLEELWLKINGKLAYLQELKSKNKVEILLGYRSNWPDGGFCLSERALEVLHNINLPLGITIVVITDDLENILLK